MNDSSILLALPEDIRVDVARAAAADDTTPQEWVRRAITRQLRDREWGDLLAYGEARARALGRREDDVERLIEEVRREVRAPAPAGGRPHG